MKIKITEIILTDVQIVNFNITYISLTSTLYISTTNKILNKKFNFFF